jgi:hypothetical protein
MASLRIASALVALGAHLGASASASAQSSVHDFQLRGSARVEGEDCIRLTPDVPFVSGAAWFREPVDLGRPFDVQLSLVLGEKDQRGADGIGFILHPTTGNGFRGEGMGFSGLVPSWGLEFDTYQNVHLNDPASDHLAAVVDGRTFHALGDRVVRLGNLEDRTRHPLRIQWRPTEGRLVVHLDDEPRASFPSETVRRALDGRSTVYWGMTAATGRLSNEQLICFEAFLLAGSGFGPSPIRSDRADASGAGSGPGAGHRVPGR